MPLGEPLPQGLAQPFTLLVMPRASGQAWGCPSPLGRWAPDLGEVRHG
jgi:hypothetical protein